MDLVQAYIARIEESTYIARIEESNEDFRSVLEINPDAIRVAKSLDAERNRAGRRG